MAALWILGILLALILLLLLLRVTIHQGKNRQVRRMCARIGLHVARLQRVQEDTLLLGSLPPGKWRYLTDKELQSIKGGAACE